MIATPPSPSDRLLSSAGYLGLAPLARLWRSRSSNPFLQHHHAQAMSAVFCLLLLFLAACLFDTAECFVAIRFPEFAQQLTERWGSFLVNLSHAMWLPILALIALWITLLGLALAGSSWQMPLLKRLLHRPWVTRVSFLANSIVLALIPLIAFFALHATSLTRRSSDNAAVYFLYDEGVSVPRWGFALGLYRVSLQAQQKWGRGCTVLDSLNKETLRTALANGKVVILATHGADGYATTSFAPEVLRVWPSDTGATDERSSSRFLRASVLGTDHKWGEGENVAVSDHLQLAYLFACHGGKKASEWTEHLAPARVITYDRFSTVWDHAIWFAFTGPAQMKKLP
jgi:hypothetical protein